jgi:hypothetical protein
MFMFLVGLLFGVLAYRGYPWLTLALAIPLATLAGLLDTPPNLEELRIFASDFMKVLTKAIVCSVINFALCRFIGFLVRARLKPS